MNNYKIKVNNEAESKEAQELFFELGYGWCNEGKTTSYTEYKIIHAWDDGQLTYCDHDFHGSRDFQEITLQQLRDLVVLKRNKIEDATHASFDIHNRKGYVTSDGLKYVWNFQNKAWGEKDESYFKYHGLKPISEQQMASHSIEQQELQANPKLFLDPTQNYAEIEWDGSFMKQDHWIKVSDYADYLYVSDCGKETWTINPSNSYGQLVWQRTQDEPFFTPESVLPQDIDATLAERQSTYGDFTHVANTTGKLFAEIKNGKNAHMLPYAHEEALHMICSKIARIVNGDCNHKDSWHDIAGYAKLIENLIKD